MALNDRNSERLIDGIVVDETLAERLSIMMDDYRADRLQHSSCLKTVEQELHVSEIIHLFHILLFIFCSAYLWLPN